MMDLLKERVGLYSNEELLKMYERDYDQYTLAALAIIRDELVRRELPFTEWTLEEDAVRDARDRANKRTGGLRRIAVMLLVFGIIPIALRFLPPILDAYLVAEPRTYGSVIFARYENEILTQFLRKIHRDTAQLSEISADKIEGVRTEYGWTGVVLTAAVRLGGPNEPMFQIKAKGDRFWIGSYSDWRIIASKPISGKRK